MSIEYPEYPEAIPGDDAARLFEVIRQAVRDLDAIHWPQGVPGHRRCVACPEPWPCSSRTVADNLRFMLGEME